MTNIAAYLARQRAWSERTFGPGKRTIGILKHIEKEIDEVLAEPDSLEEWIDIVILALDGAWRAGYTPQEVEAKLQQKQLINFHRQWPPQSPEHETNEHIREEPQLCAECGYTAYGCRHPSGRCPDREDDAVGSHPTRQ